MTASQPIGFAGAEEVARAEVYGLLASLFYAPPSAAMHAQLQAAATDAPEASGWLARSWADLVAAARRQPRERIEAEYDRLFQGVGRPAVFLYGSYHLAGRLNERPLVAVRETLRELGVEKSDAVSESEDHIATLCDTMRWLIAGDDAATANLATQRRFFESHLRPWAGALCDAVEAQPDAEFYAALARFARDFFAVEQQAFDLLDR